MGMKSIFKNSKGSTLTEVLVATVILGISLIYIFGAFNSQFIQFKYGRERLLATSLANQLAEDLEAHYDDAVVGSDRVNDFQDYIKANYNYDLIFQVQMADIYLKKLFLQINKDSRKLVRMEFLIVP